jgi:hypothetical protein
LLQPRSIIARKRIGLTAILSLVVAYAVVAQGAGWNQNAHYALVRAFADHTTIIDRTRYETGKFYPTGDISYYRGHIYSNKAPGLAFASLPPYLVLKAVGKAKPVPDPTSRLWFLGLWTVVLPAGVLLLLTRRIGNEFETGFGTAAALTLGLATLVLPFSTLFFSHVLSATLGFTAFTLLWYERRSSGDLWCLAAAGALVGYGIATEFSCAITAAVLGLYALARPRAVRRAAAYIGGALVGIAPLLAYNQWSVGSPFRLAYSNSVLGPGQTYEFASPSFRQAVELLFGPVGLLRTTPVVALGAVGAVILYRRGGRAEAAVISGVVLAFLIFNAAFGGAVGGSSPGPRYMIPTLPFLAAPLALVYRRFPVTTLLLAAASFIEMAAVTITHPVEYWESYTGWFRQVRDGNFVATVLSFFGRIHLDALKLPSSPHWHPLLLFVVPVVLAVGLATVELPHIHMYWHDALRAVACFAGWLVVQKEAPRFLEGHGVGRNWAPVVVLLLAAAVALFALALPALFGSGAGPLREGESSRA